MIERHGGTVEAHRRRGRGRLRPDRGARGRRAARGPGRGRAARGGRGPGHRRHRRGVRRGVRRRAASRSRPAMRSTARPGSEAAAAAGETARRDVHRLWRRRAGRAAPGGRLATARARARSRRRRAPARGRASASWTSCAPRSTAPATTGCAAVTVSARPGSASRGSCASSRRARRRRDRGGRPLPVLRRGGRPTGRSPRSSGSWRRRPASASTSCSTATSLARLVLGAIGLSDGRRRRRRPSGPSAGCSSAWRRAPAGVVVEDVHWAESTLLDLLEYLVAFSSGHADPARLPRPARAAGDAARVGRATVEPLAAGARRALGERGA